MNATWSLDCDKNIFYSSITSLEIINQRGNYDDNNIFANSAITPYFPNWTETT